jgi:3-oxoadipate enol-lactonase
MLVWLDDFRLNARLTGPETAPPVVLIQGLGLDLGLWDALLPSLSGHQVLRMDLRGHGLSDTPAPPYALGGLIRDVERLIDHFALKDAVVLGSGEGGLIAQGLAVKRLDLVRAMVLSGTATRFGNPDWWEARIGKVRAQGLDPATECAALLGPRWPQLPETAAVQAMLASTRPDGWLGVAAAVATADLYQTTASLTLPTLILVGSEDRKTPPDMQRELADLVAGSDLHLLRGGSHLSMLAQPGDFAQALLGFMTRIGHA